MDSFERGILIIIRLIGATFILWSAMDLSLDLLISLHNHKPLNVLNCVLESLPMLCGIAMLVKARPIAKWVCDKLE